jgi:hypothetical protein
LVEAVLLLEEKHRRPFVVQDANSTHIKMATFIYITSTRILGPHDHIYIYVLDIYAGWLNRKDLLDGLEPRLECYGNHCSYGTSDRRVWEGVGIEGQGIGGGIRVKSSAGVEGMPTRQFKNGVEKGPWVGT